MTTAKKRILFVVLGVITLWSCTYNHAWVNETTAYVKNDKDTRLVLGDGAELVIMAGGLENESRVTLKIVNSDQKGDIIVPDDIEMGEIYEIDAPEWNPNLEARITLPLDKKNFDEFEARNYRLAYYAGDQWVEVPTVVNVEEGKISGSLHHFSFWAWLKSPKSPKVYIETSPKIYSVTTDKAMNTEMLRDLSVKVYVDGDDQKNILVFVAFGLETLYGQTVYELNLYRERMGEIASIPTGDPVTDMFVENTLRMLAPKAQKKIMTSNWILAHKETDGYYIVKYPSHKLELESHLTNVYVYVLAINTNTKKQVEDMRRIHITQDIVPSPLKLKSPGPAYTVCPPQPIFEWAHGGNYNRSYRFRLVKGDDPWSGPWAQEEWVCRWLLDEKQCAGSNNSPTQFSENQWIPPKPLKAGAYSWGIAVSANEKEKSFQGDKIVYSDVFRFTVDPLLTGYTCKYTTEDNALKSYLAGYTLTPTITPSPTSAPSTFTPSSTPTLTFTPTPNAVTLYMDKNYNCREGPSTSFKHVFDALQGQQYRILARTTTGWYQIAINDPRTSKNSCWIGGGKTEGHLSSIPIVEVQIPSSGVRLYKFFDLGLTDPSEWQVNSILSCQELSQYRWGIQIYDGSLFLLPGPVYLNGDLFLQVYDCPICRGNPRGFFASEGRRVCPDVVK